MSILKWSVPVLIIAGSIWYFTGPSEPVAPESTPPIAESAAPAEPVREVAASAALSPGSELAMNAILISRELEGQPFSVKVDTSPDTGQPVITVATVGELPIAMPTIEDQAEIDRLEPEDREAVLAWKSGKYGPMTAPDPGN